MRFAALAFGLAVAAAMPAFAADAPAAPVRIQASEAAQHVGETVTVVGVLTNVHKTPRKAVLWDIGGTYPANPFTVYVNRNDNDVVPDVSPLIGKTIAVTGIIKLYQNKPEINVTNPKQVGVAQ
ncbi:MAG: hypothetical protein ISS15_16095 [Alphaproteobacteria bacterium]|nr:hypothetical protein [Alphaproteobacteria bacterium]MBL6937994.1 hypothetical protein [Alphaproteobacteria bacterium]MBL7099181.1 hypothetical protein [Alphaproteobacteria bacterium]